MSGEIVKAPPAALTAAQAKADLAVARARAIALLERTQADLEGLTDWRATVRKHPLVAVGSAFVVGYALARLFSRR